MSDVLLTGSRRQVAEQGALVSVLGQPVLIEGDRPGQQPLLQLPPTSSCIDGEIRISFDSSIFLAMRYTLKDPRISARRFHPPGLNLLLVKQ